MEGVEGWKAGLSYTRMLSVDCGGVISESRECLCGVISKVDESGECGGISVNSNLCGAKCSSGNNLCGVISGRVRRALF